MDNEYRNIFCFMCNNGTLNNTDDTCEVPWKYNNGYKDGIGFSSLIDINFGQPAIVDEEDDQCDPAEIHDSITVC